MKDLGNLKTPPGDGLIWQLVQKLDELRRYPRIPLDTPVALVSGQGAKCRALAINVSPDGLQLRCDVDAARLLHPQGGRIDPANGPRVIAGLTLTVRGDPVSLVTPCRLLYLTTVDSEPRCVLGLRFEPQDRKTDSIVNAYFADQLSVETDVA